MWSMVNGKHEKSTQSGIQFIEHPNPHEDAFLCKFPQQKRANPTQNLSCLRIRRIEVRYELLLLLLLPRRCITWLARRAKERNDYHPVHASVLVLNPVALRRKSDYGSTTSNRRRNMLQVMKFYCRTMIRKSNSRESLVNKIQVETMIWGIARSDRANLTQDGWRVNVGNSAN